MKTITAQELQVVVGHRVTLKYPVHGTRNILASRSGVIEDAGIGPAGPYVTVRCDDGTVRNFSRKRMVDAVLS